MSTPIRCFHSAQALQKFWESTRFMLSVLTTAPTRFLFLLKRNKINISVVAASVIPPFAQNLLQNMNLSSLVRLVALLIFPNCNLHEMTVYLGQSNRGNLKMRISVGSRNLNKTFSKYILQLSSSLLMKRLVYGS